MAVALIRFHSVALVAIGVLAACAQADKPVPPSSAKVETSRDAIAQPMPDTTAAVIDPVQPAQQCVPETARIIGREAIMNPFAERIARLTCECVEREVQQRWTLAQARAFLDRSDPVVLGRLLGISGVCMDRAQRTVFPS